MMIKGSGQYYIKRDYGPVWDCCAVGESAFESAGWRIAFESAGWRSSRVFGKLIFKSVVSTKSTFRVFGKLSVKTVVAEYNY
jgi:hypothetical protein